MNYTDLTQVLVWLAVGIGAPYVVGQVVSILASNSLWWRSLPTNVKFIVPLVVSVLISIGANLLLKQPEFVAVISPYFSLVMSAIFSYLGTQQAYQNSLKSGYDQGGTAARLEAGKDKSVPTELPH